MTRVTRNARIQALYREVNERIAAISTEWRVPELELLCECGTAGCTLRVLVKPADYELLRSRPTHFLLRPGHQDAGVEDVIKRNVDYLIVANYGAAADIARSTDPRANSR